MLPVDLRGPLAVELDGSAIVLGADAQVFARRIATSSVPLTLSRDAAYRYLRAELIHLQHPLTRYAVTEIGRMGETSQRAFAISLEQSRLPAGAYGFLISLVHVKSHRPMARLVAVIATRDGEKVWFDPEETTPVVVEMLEHGRDVETPRVSQEESESVKNCLLSAMERLKTEWDARERRLDQARREQQHAARRATLEFRLQRAVERHHTLIKGRSHEFAVKMAQAQVEKAKRERDSLLSTSPATLWGGIEHEELAVGLLFVRGDIL